MYDRILVPTDGSETVDAVLDAAFDLADRDDAVVHLLNVADTTRMGLTTAEANVTDILRREGQTIVDGAAERAQDRGLDAIPMVQQGPPAPTIVQYAQDEAVDLVVMPTHGRTGVARFFLGSVTERVVRTSEVPVLAIRPAAAVRLPFERILVPTDGSAAADRALETALSVAADHDASLDLLAVIDTASLGPDVGSYVDVDRLEKRAETTIADAADIARDASGEEVTTTVEFGTPHREIRRYVEDHDVDLVVMGTHGHTGLDRYLLGSTTEKVLRTAPVPVLTVHGPGED